MIDEKLMSEHLEEEKTQEEIEAEGFLQQLKEPERVLASEGHHAGLCKACLGTDHIYIFKPDGYEGIEYRIDNEIKTFSQCYEGKDFDSPF